MRRHRTFKYIALLVGFLVLGALFFACAADPGDVSKLNEATTGGNTNTNAVTMQVTQSSTGISTGTAAGPTATQSSTGTGTGSSTGVSTSPTGSTTGTGTGTSSSTETATANDASPPCTTCMLQLAYEATTTGDGVTNIQFNVQVTNTGSGAQDLTQMTIQYYFTSDGAGASGMSDQITTAQIQTAGPPYNQDISADTTGAFSALTPSTATADTVLTISFSSGSLAAGGVLVVDIRAFSSNYATLFTQSNDYSYDGADTTFTPSQTITIDVAGATVWGMAP